MFMYFPPLAAPPAVTQTTWICENYQLTISPATVRNRIRSEYKKSKGVSDLQTIDKLIFKSRIEYEEAMNNWTQQSQVMRYFDQPRPEDTKPVDFLGRFYAGRD
ncbi:hypothetical protein HK100_011116 [Physocladia obscura]|uniref:NADH dehydrogenase [ubiquinone] 1 alpha subcomplex subunit 6 n=1 Tax=Physocladia obscura TaxID=109957 RepID=A0AAD5XDH4_9FUNG|nr:hypothetical protein HK100_011116 [Physocladia obscura]